MDRPFPVCRTIDSRVMKHHENTVRRTSHINLYEVHAESYSFPDRCQGVFRRMSRSPPMADFEYATHWITWSHDRGRPARTTHQRLEQIEDCAYLGWRDIPSYVFFRSSSQIE